MAPNIKSEVNTVSYADFNNPAGQTTIQGIREFLNLKMYISQAV